VLRADPIEQEGTYPLPEAQLDRFNVHDGGALSDAAEDQVMKQATDELQAELTRLLTGRRS